MVSPELDEGANHPSSVMFEARSSLPFDRLRANGTQLATINGGAAVVVVHIVVQCCSPVPKARLDS